MTTKPDRHENMPFGLPERTADDIRRFLKGWPEAERVTIFGSRATGTWRYNSDIDLCIRGKSLNAEIFERIQRGFNDLPVPYKFDVIQYETITNPALKEHIDSCGADFI
jgi:predicted nucleotidyltransferase